MRSKFWPWVFLGLAIAGALFLLAAALSLRWEMSSRSGSVVYLLDRWKSEVWSINPRQAKRIWTRADFDETGFRLVRDQADIFDELADENRTNLSVAPVR